MMMKMKKMKKIKLLIFGIINFKYYKIKKINDIFFQISVFYNDIDFIFVKKCFSY